MRLIRLALPLLLINPAHLPPLPRLLLPLLLIPPHLLLILLPLRHHLRIMLLLYPPILLQHLLNLLTPILRLPPYIHRPQPRVLSLPLLLRTLNLLLLPLLHFLLLYYELQTLRRYHLPPLIPYLV